MKGYRLWDLNASKFLTNRVVTFNEFVFLLKIKSWDGVSKEVE